MAVLIGAAVLVACGPTGGQGVVRPTVVSAVPANGSTDVGVTQALVITFSRAMNQPVTAGALTISTGGTCTPSWNPESTILTCTPDANWPFATNVTVTIGTAAADTQGNTLAAPFSFSFTTVAAPAGPAPEVLATIPADGDDNIALNQSLILIFSRSMNQDATGAAIEIEPATTCDFSMNFDLSVLTCVPQGNWLPDTVYSVTIGTGATGVNGVSLEAPVSFSFTTSDFVNPTCVFGSTTFGGCTFGP